MTPDKESLSRSLVARQESQTNADLGRAALSLTSFHDALYESLREKT